MKMLSLLLLALVAYLIYVAIIKPMRYWKDRNIPHKKPWPIIGNYGEFFLRKRSFVDVLKQIYNYFPNRRYYGIFNIGRPQILIRDPELIKQVLIKGFDYFMDRPNVFGDDTEGLFSKNLSVLQGQKWRHMRSTLSPCFTSSKMRFMFNLISDCAKQFTEYFQKQGSDVISTDMKDIYSRFTNDAIATCAFGITVNSLTDRQNEFFVMGKGTINFGGIRILKIFAFSVFPTLMKFFKISILPKRFAKFFVRVVRETIEVRETKGVIRPDMIHILLEARKGKSLPEDGSTSDAGFAVVEEFNENEITHQEKAPLTDADITAQVMVFFLAGFETASTLMCFMSHELVVNTDIQEKLQQEVDETLVRCNGKITYEGLLGMKYLDMVVSETLRKWPPGTELERRCTKDYVIKPELPGEELFIIEKGVSVAIPVVGIHHDPKYFPMPDKFDPERFSDENKSSIVPFTYMPFGAGPRNCIASRFALLMTKIMFFHLLSKFDIVPTEKTRIPLVLSKLNIIPVPDNLKEDFGWGFARGNRVVKSLMLFDIILIIILIFTVTLSFCSFISLWL